MPVKAKSHISVEVTVTESSKPEFPPEFEPKFKQDDKQMCISGKAINSWVSLLIPFLVLVCLRAFSKVLSGKNPFSLILLGFTKDLLAPPLPHLSKLSRVANGRTGPWVGLFPISILSNPSPDSSPGKLNFFQWGPSLVIPGASSHFRYNHDQIEHFSRA